MAAARRETQGRGLPSLNEARAERRSALLRGKYTLPRGLTPRFWLWSAVILAAVSVIYWKVAQGKLESQKSAVMAKQRAIAQALEPEVVPYAERIEGFVRQLAGGTSGRVMEGTELEDIQTAPSIYLRMRLANAGDAKSIRRAAAESLHDAFVACLFVRKGAPDPTRGSKCRSSADCDAGLLCNEYEVCTLPPKPYNMRLAYRALRVLSPEWTDDLHETTNELEVRLRERELERAAHDDVPIAIQMMKSAKYFVLVLDEDPQGGLPAKATPGETEEQRVQRVPHDARVGVWELGSGRQLVSLRLRASGEFVPAGERVVEAPENLAAQRRQANSCALALSMKGAVMRATGAPEP